jgi:hypothetical protein
MALAAIAQLLILAARQGQALTQQRHAIALAANLLEQIAASPWDELTSEKLQPLRESGASSVLPRCEVQIDVIEHTLPPSREIRVRVQWPRPGASPGHPVQLSAWRFPDEARAL